MIATGTSRVAALLVQGLQDLPAVDAREDEIERDRDRPGLVSQADGFLAVAGPHSPQTLTRVVVIEIPEVPR